MGAIVKKFEDFKIWQEAMILIKEIYSCTSKFKDYSCNDQIQRATVSVMNYIAEGYESGSNIMFKKFLQIAKGSCGEVRSMLYIAIDLKYFDEDKANGSIKDCKCLASAIKHLVGYLNQYRKN